MRTLFGLTTMVFIKHFARNENEDCKKNELNSVNVKVGEGQRDHSQKVHFRLARSATVSTLHA